MTKQSTMIEVSNYICPSCGGVSLLDESIVNALKDALGFISTGGALR